MISSRASVNGDLAIAGQVGNRPVALIPLPFPSHPRSEQTASKPMCDTMNIHTNPIPLGRKALPVQRLLTWLALFVGVLLLGSTALAQLQIQVIDPTNTVWRFHTNQNNIDPGYVP